MAFQFKNLGAMTFFIAWVGAGHANPPEDVHDEATLKAIKEASGQGKRLGESIKIGPNSKASQISCGVALSEQEISDISQKLRGIRDVSENANRLQADKLVTNYAAKISPEHLKAFQFQKFMRSSKAFREAIQNDKEAFRSAMRDMTVAQEKYKEAAERVNIGNTDKLNQAGDELAAAQQHLLGLIKNSSMSPELKKKHTQLLLRANQQLLKQADQHIGTPTQMAKDAAKEAVVDVALTPLILTGIDLSNPTKQLKSFWDKFLASPARGGNTAEDDKELSKIYCDMIQDPVGPWAKKGSAELLKDLSR